MTGGGSNPNRTLEDLEAMAERKKEEADFASFFSKILKQRISAQDRRKKRTGATTGSAQQTTRRR